MFLRPSGNRIRKLTYRNNELTSVISVYNAKNQLVKTTEGESVTQFTYSYRGSLVTEGTTNRYYDCRNRQTCYANSEHVATYYTYYIDGLRKSKKVGNGETKYFIWSNGNMVYEFTATDETKYFFGLHLVSSDDYRYVLNAHGDVIALVSKTGSTIAKYYEYDAFGNEINPDSSDTNPYRYCGEYFDTESGTIYLRARYYSPVHGRFTQPDRHWNTDNMIYGDADNTNADAEQAAKLLVPDILAIRQSGNLYVYGLSNPICNIDSSGESVTAVLLFVTIVGGLLTLTGCGRESNIQYSNRFNNIVTSSYNSDTGYYGVASGTSRVRHISGGLSASTTFYNQITAGYVSEEITSEGAIIRIMSDGSVYTFRETSADGTSVIDINGNNSGKKSQKIHFID